MGLQPRLLRNNGLCAITVGRRGQEASNDPSPAFRHVPPVGRGCRASALAACDEKKPGAAAGAAPRPAVLVVTTTEHPMTQGSEFVGRVEALERVDIRARVTGFLRERTFAEGQMVRADDMVFALEREPFGAHVALKRAAVEVPHEGK